MSSSRYTLPSENTDDNLATRIIRQVVAEIPNMVAQLYQTLGPQNLSDTTPHQRTLQHFNSYNPTKYDGSEGTIRLLRWYEDMEDVFLLSGCPEDLKVFFVTTVLQDTALTWWNGVENARGIDTAMTLGWNEVRDLMTNIFCPRTEVKKLEDEFWNLKQVNNENLAYTTRFCELSLLVPHLVTPLTRAIEKYISGLPTLVQHTIRNHSPRTLEYAFLFAAAFSVTNDIIKKPFDDATTKSSKKVNAESSSTPLKRKFNDCNPNHTTQTTFVTQNTRTKQTNKKLYIGPYPNCNNCNFHHPCTAPCRQCSTCGRFGHLTNICRTPIRPQAYQPNTQSNVQINTPPIIRSRICYQCGNSNHFRNTCPQLVISNDSQADQPNSSAQDRALKH